MFMVREAVHEALHQFLLQLFGQVVDVLVMEVKGLLANPGPVGQLLDRDFFQRLLGAQLDKGV